jgi:hypothetical protein
MIERSLLKEIAANSCVISAMRIDDRKNAEVLTTGPELHIPTAAAQTRVVSVARIRLDSANLCDLSMG